MNLTADQMLPRFPPWAAEFGEDDFGIFAVLEMESKAREEPVRFEFRWIWPGEFNMGSPDEEKRRVEHEGPRHVVAITRGFWLLETPVTQAQWVAVMGNNPSNFKGDDRPVENVSLHDCMKYSELLNELFPGLDAGLPTETQWERACRAEADSAFNDGSNCTEPTGADPALEKLGWYKKNSGQETQPVKQKQPNAWGLYDMHGNVWEWCRDGLRDYSEDSEIDPVGPQGDDARRAIRGGSWVDFAGCCRSAYRGWGGDRYSRYLGFRLATGLSLESKE